MRYLSVCSGIEAATVAWEPLGWTPVAFSEVDPFPSAVLRHHYPGVPNLGDMTRFKDWTFDGAAVDVLVGGTPCQSFSVAGLRAGLDDPRGSLMLTYLAIALRLRPRWVVWENVPGVLSADDGRAFGTLLGGLAECGYGFAHRVLDAQYFGLAQRRKRVFVVGHLGDWRRAAAVLIEYASLRGDPAPSRDAGQRLAPTVGGGPPFSRTGNERVEAEALVAMTAPTIPSRSTAGGGLGTDFDCDGGLIPVPILDGAKGRGDRGIARDGSAMGNPGDPMFTLRECSSHAVAFHNRQDPDISGAVTHPLGAQDNGMAVAFAENQRAEITINDTAGSLKVGGGKPGQGYPAIQQQMSVRRLTPRECERLQGFRDDYTLIPYRGKPASDGPRYKALGNSMAVPVMAWIGRRIAEVDAL